MLYSCLFISFMSDNDNKCTIYQRSVAVVCCCHRLNFGNPKIDHDNKYTNNYCKLLPAGKVQTHVGYSVRIYVQ